MPRAFRALRAGKAAATAANANPISSLGNCIVPTAFIFYRIAKCTCDRVTCSDYRSQRFESREQVADNDWLTGKRLFLRQ